MSSIPDSINLEDWIRDIPDFPQKGVLFKDITPLLQDGAAFHAALDRLAAHYQGSGIQTVVGVESRGFIFGAPLAYLLNCGFVPVRKFGKLPASTVSVEYALEYGTNVVEMHTDGIRPGQRVLIVDDLLATGGTVSAAMEGALAGVRSIALSQAYSREGMGDTVPFAAAEAWAERVAAAAGYTQVSHTLEVFGLCPEHSARPKSQGRTSRGRSRSSSYRPRCATDPAS